MINTDESIDKFKTKIKELAGMTADQRIISISCSFKDQTAKVFGKDGGN